MTDHSVIESLTSDCERYWKAAGLRRREVEEMRLELERHLLDAAAEGRDPRSVVGDDPAVFAREWASEKRGGSDGLPKWEEVFRARRRGLRWTDLAILGAVGVGIAFALTTRNEGGSTVDNETWRWIWVGAALFLAFAEMATAGFFMLPFAVGALVAAVLAFVDVAPAAQMGVFIVVSTASLILLQKFVRKEDEKQPPVGANRLVGQRAVVVEALDRVTGMGRVRMETELWRAVPALGVEDPVAEGTHVRVIDVTGTRLVVEPID